MTAIVQPALSVTIFGEKTSLPMKVTKVVIRATDPIPFARKASVSLQIHLTNETVEHDVVAKLQLALPIGASVKKFELQRNDQWYPATAVKKQKAKAVVYKEKEKGRAVAAVSNSAIARNMFEMEISPLPYKKETICRLEVLTEGDAQELVESMKAIAGAQVDAQQLPYPERSESHAGAIVGECFGKTHFLCQVPSMSLDDATVTNPLGRVAVFWDTSASMKEGTDIRCARLMQLFEKAGTNTAELYSFGMGAPEQIGTYTGRNLAEIFPAIRAIAYNGGTDLTMLPDTFDSLVKRQSKDAIDAMLVFTDGVDNLGRTPEFGPSISFPVHCIADTSKNINLFGLKAIAAASSTKPGAVLTKTAKNYLDGILFQQPVLQSILVDQDEGAFLEETDDGFSCVPDHRLKCLNLPIPDEGIRICGTVGNRVTKLTARVVLGNRLHLFQYELRAGRDTETRGAMFHDETKEADVLPETSHICNTTYFGPSEEIPAARILGHIYAEELYREAEAFGIKSGQGTERIKESLAVCYGFCSPESTLLMLYEPEQFEEHGISPPAGHPAAKKMPHKAEQEEHSYDKGAVGGLKNSEQRKQVVALAERMRSFFTVPKMETPIPRGRCYPVSVTTQRKAFDSEESESESEDDEETPNPRGRSYPAAKKKADDSEEEESEYEDDGEEGEGYFAKKKADDSEEEESESESENDGEEGEEYFAWFRSSASATQPRELGFLESGILLGTGFEGFGDDLGDMECCYDDDESDFDCSEDEGDVDLQRGPNPPRAQEETRTTAVSAPKDPLFYTDLLDKAFKNDNSEDSWREAYQKQLLLEGGYESVSPSFFLNIARVLIRHKKPMDAIRVAANCLETGLEDVQLLRSVGYVLLSSETEYGLNLAIQLFDKVRELSPLEPQSYLDTSLARFWRSWKASQENQPNWTTFLKDLTLAQEGLVHVLTHKWAYRFDEVEWPVLVLLHFIRDFVREVTKHSPSTTTGLEEWPRVFEEKEDDAALWIDEFDPALMVWLGWDTDHTDVDLHVLEPSRNEVYYGRKRGKGSIISRDFREGYGPEVYIARNGVADAGSYGVYARYFASHQDSRLTGTTSAVIWTIEKKGDKKLFKFDFVRLNTHMEKSMVGTATVEEPSEKRMRLSQEFGGK